MVVFDATFCDQSTNTFAALSDLAMRDTTRSGKALSSSIATSRAHSDARLLVIGSSIGT